MKMRKILFVVPTLTGGGAERVVSILASALSNEKYKVSLLLNTRCENEYFIDEKVQIYNISEHVNQQKGFLAKILRIYYRYQITKKVQPDITIVFLNDAIQFLCNIPLKGKFVSTVRVNPRSGKLMQRVLKYIIVWLSDACLVQNSEQKKYFNKIIQKKTYILPNPIKQDCLVEDIVIREYITKIVTLGRLTEQKNHQLLIKAFKLARENHPEWMLEIYGQGEEKENLEDLINKLELKNSVFLRGRTKDAKKSLMEADLFVLSSNYEGMPNALLEAMAVGVPSISTDCPTGPSDIIINNENGVLVKVNDENEMSRAIVKMQDFEFRRKISKNAHEYVKLHYSIDRIVSKLSEYIEEILNK